VQPRRRVRRIATAAPGSHHFPYKKDYNVSSGGSAVPGACSATWLRATFVAALAALSPVGDAVAQDGARTDVRIAYLTQTVRVILPHSYLDAPPADEGLAGARVGMLDNNTTGRFTRQSFTLDENVIAEDGNVVDAFRKIASSGVRLVVADLPAQQLIALVDLPEAKGTTFFNAGSKEDELRAEQCRANVLHLIPSRAMLADALAQYLVAKRWRNVFLVTGPTASDEAYAAAIKRAIRKFGARLVAEKVWNYDPGARRTDTGHFSIASEVARFTQGISYDVLVVADEAGAFGDDLGYRTTEPRPIAGTHGLVPTIWARPFEQWGATQLQNRFLRQSNRWMAERDHAAWMAVRAIGEAATRAKSTEPDKIVAYMKSDQFDLAAFKGGKLSFRSWDNQLRQPILLADARSLVSVSPQQGFLHQHSELDTLGTDRPETQCRLR
jgi:ABC transporter substrate binding protein (PQQ-dependent alcohol dehydrogenase system)